MAEYLGVPARTWFSYERGVAIPGPVILKIIVEFSVEPEWLLHGKGPRFRLADAPLTLTPFRPEISVSSLVLLAISYLGQERTSEPVSA
jgi:hypothetical protein